MSEEPLPAEMPGRDPSGRFLPRNPPQRSAERQHLDALIERRDQLLAHAARLSDARERVNLRELEASRAQAAAALRKAEEQAPQLSAVLQTDPRVEMLWQRHHEARQVVADLDRCLRVVDHAGGIEPADRGWAAFREYPDRGNSEAWKLAVAKLAVDADPLLPVSEEEELRGAET